MSSAKRRTPRDATATATLAPDCASPPPPGGVRAKARAAAAAPAPRRRRSAHPPALTHFGTLPPHLADNEFIRAFYRPVQSPAHAVRSLWRLHNETGNIWSHALGFLLFLALTAALLAAAPASLHLHDAHHLPRLEAALASAGRRAARAEAAALARVAAGAHAAEAAAEKALAAARGAALAAGHSVAEWEAALASDASAAARRAAASLLGGRWPTPRWPALVFLAGALGCLGTSAVCHLFGCCTEHVAAAFWRADYAGIVALIVTSFVPPLMYGFECSPGWRDFYLTAIVLLGAAVFAVALLPFFQAPRFRVLRAVVFTALAGFGIAPALHGLALHYHEPAMRSAFAHLMAMGGLYLAGVALFATRVPERWAPGTFDVWGHSHQLFHVAIVAAAATHYRGVRVLLEWRDRVGGVCA